MDSKIEMSQVYDTLLCSPGMDEIVRIDLKLPRKTLLILCHAIEKGSDAEKAGLPNLPENISKEFCELLLQISKDCLEKAGLQPLSQKLKTFIPAQ